RGAFCSYPDNLTRALCWDVDSAEAWEVLTIHARALALAGYFPILEQSPSGRGGHLWIIFEKLVNADASRHAVHTIVPELAKISEHWPNQYYGKGNRVRLPGGRYTAYGVNSWCQLVSVADGEHSSNGKEA